MSMKVILKAQLDCEKCKRRAMKTVAGVEGVESVQIDSKDNKITVIGDPDPVSITTKLRKFGRTELVSVGPAKEPQKPKPAQTDQKKDDQKDEKKDAPKKDEKKGGDAKKDQKKEGSSPAPNITYVYLPKPEPYGGGYTYYLSDENPNSCTIC